MSLQDLIQSNRRFLETANRFSRQMATMESLNKHAFLQNRLEKMLGLQMQAKLQSTQNLMLQNVGGIAQRLSALAQMQQSSMKHIAGIHTLETRFNHSTVAALRTSTAGIAESLRHIDVRSIAATFDLSHSAREITSHLRSMEKMSSSFAGIVTDITSRTITSPVPDVFIEKPPRLMRSALIGLRILDPEGEVSEEEKNFLVESTDQIEACRAELKKLSPRLLDIYNSIIAESVSTNPEAGTHAAASAKKFVGHLIAVLIDKYHFKAWERRERDKHKDIRWRVGKKLMYLFDEWSCEEMPAFVSNNNESLSTYCFLLNHQTHTESIEVPISEHQLRNLQAWTTETVLFLIRVAALKRNM